MIRDEELLKSAMRGKYRKGWNYLVSYLKGGKISRGKAIYAKCYDCNGMVSLISQFKTTK